MSQQKKTKIRYVGNNFVGMKKIVGLVREDEGYLEAKRYLATLDRSRMSAEIQEIAIANKKIFESQNG